MPILPPITPQVFDNLNSIITAAQSRLGQYLTTLQPVSGKILDTDTDSGAQQAVNSAWRKLQEYLANLGFSAQVDETVISGVPVVANLDPATQTRLSWFGFFDGQNTFQQPALPTNLILPMVLWERWAGQNMPFFNRMTLILDGLSGFNKSTWNGQWEWRSNAIYMPGSLRVMDIQIRYASYLPDFTDVATTRWYAQPVPMMRCQDAFSLFVCAEVMIAKGTDAAMILAGVFNSQAERAADLMMNRDIRQKDRANVRRQPRSGRSHQGWGWC